MSDPTPYTIPDPEYPFLKKITECAQYRNALKFWEDPPLRFLKWLESKDIDPALVEPRTEMRLNIEKRIRKSGKHWQARQWRVQAREEITKLKLEGLRRPAIQELVWWLVEDVLHDFDCDPETPKYDREEELAGMEFLPEWMRWVALHPALAQKEDESEQDRFKTTKYEKVFPCPNQAARTMLTNYRGDKKMLDSFFKDCLKRNFDDMKAGNTPEDLAAEAEHKRINKLEDVLGLKKPA